MMKQMWKMCLVVALVIVTGLVGYGWQTDEDEQILKEPPRLVVQCGTYSVKAGNGPHEWRSAIVDEKVELESIVDRGDNARDYDKSILTPLRLPEEAVKNRSLVATLDFDGSQPDAVTVRYWPQDEYWQYEDVDQRATSIPVASTEADGDAGESAYAYVFPLFETGGLYEVTAEWTRDDRYGGTASYAFRTEA